MTKREGWRTRLAGAVALAVAGLAPLTAYVGNLGFAPLIALAGLVSAATLGGGGRVRGPLFGVLLAAALLAAASYGWGVIRPTAFPRYDEVEELTALKLLLQAALYGAFVCTARDASPAAGRRALTVLGVGFALVALLLLAEAFGGAAFYQWIKREAHQATRPDLAKRNVARATYAAALVLWPAMLCLRSRGWTGLAALAGLGTLAAALLFRVDAPVVALALSAAVFAAVRFGGAIAAQALGAATIAVIATAPLLTFLADGLAPAAAGGVAKASWGARLQVWSFVGDRIRERPWLGWGLDGSRAFPGQVPLHPHDFALQVWLELGVVGAALAALFWWCVWAACARLARSDRELGAAAAAGAAAYLVIGALSFGAWQEWWLALGALAAAAVAWSQAARSASPSAATRLYPAPS